MHHHNCFIISALTKRLNEELAGKKLVKCFSNSIDEIYFEFEDFTFRCIFYKGELFFSFENELIGEHRLFRPQFRDNIDSNVVEVIHHPYERSFHIEFDNSTRLVLKCFGRKSNILLFKDDGVIDLFRKNIETDLELKEEQLHRNSKVEFLEYNFHSETAFIQSYPFLPIEIYHEFKSDISKEQFEKLLFRFRNLSAFILDVAILEIVPDFKHTVENILEVFTDFTSIYLKVKIFTEQKDKLQLQLSTRLKEKENYLKSNTMALDKLLSSRKDEEIGNIILANLQAIPEGVHKIIVNDVYHNKPIEIKLNEKLSAIKNAELYFKKDKARPFIIQQLKDKINKGSNELENLKQKLEIVNNASRLKDFKAFVQEKKNTSEITHLPYKYFIIEDVEILVGKHAESNEKLLNYYSDKDDLWLHAKDVGGSHVIIKMRKNKGLSESVLEKAASLAAFFSKSRNQNLVNVIYTQRKYVRKIKGGEKGQVTLSNEKSILVKPQVAL